MKAYFININTLLDCPDVAEIIDETTLEKAEQGLNDIDPEAFMFLCEADSIDQAKEAWAADWNREFPDNPMKASHR